MVRTPKEDENENLRVELFDVFKQPLYFHRQVNWLQSRFPDGAYVDIDGVCASVRKDSVEQNDWSLSPGRYVGISAIEEADEFDFEARIEDIQRELQILNDEAVSLAGEIDSSLADLIA